MDGKGRISDYRGRLDKTLASPDLTNHEMLHTLVKNQILQSSHIRAEECSDHVVERRTNELSNLLTMLRSASAKDDGWKVKQDTEELRVMYREGPEGTPFHTLLAEGYVDGSVDVCLCISCESDLYKLWWPQTTVPTFKIVSCQCLQRVGIGEQISLVRMKVSWPLSDREALIHYFVFEYFQDGLIVVLLNSISDLETIDRSTHGFSKDGLPDAQDVVRIDVVGGFAIQKVTAERSYFRTIANMDIKLDFVPPAFINFISRQLVGSGFKLYKKEVASISKGDDRFAKALAGPLYSRIREALYSENGYVGSPDLGKLKRTISNKLEESTIEAFLDKDDKRVTLYSGHTKEIVFKDDKVVNEIEEIEETDRDEIHPPSENTHNLTNDITEKMDDKKKIVSSTEVETTGEIKRTEVKKDVSISPEVHQALGTLDKIISVFREYNSNQKIVQSDSNDVNSTYAQECVVVERVSAQANEMIRENVNHESSKVGSTERIFAEPRNSSENRGSRHRGSNSHPRETNQSKIAPASPDEDLSTLSHIQCSVLHSTVNKSSESMVLDKVTEIRQSSTTISSITGDGTTKTKRKLSRFFCLRFTSEQ